MNQNIIKGFLILLVIFDHNEFAHVAFHGFLSGHGFHVVGFMVLPFLRPAGKFNSEFFKRIFFRYYYPFLIISVLMASLVAVINSTPFEISMKNLIIALYSGSSDALKTSTNMSLLWYLPSFISVLILKTALGDINRPLQIGLFFILFFLHFFVGILPREIHNYLPLGILPAIYIFPLAYIITNINNQYFMMLSPSISSFVLTIIFILVKSWQITLGSFEKIGYAVVASIAEPAALISNDLESIIGVLLIFQFSRLKFLSFIDRAGKNSLQVYLFHPFLALIIFKLSTYFYSSQYLYLFLAITLSLTTILSLVLANKFMSNNLLRNKFFPLNVCHLYCVNPVQEIAAERDA